MAPGTPQMSGRSTPVRFSSPGTPTPRGVISSPSAETSVQVAVRIRPQTSSEVANVPIKYQRVAVQATPGSSSSLVIDATSAGSQTGALVASPPTTSRSNKQHFAFDRVFSAQNGQSDVFGIIEPLIDRFLEGYNVSLLAYGQTSSGKSYTMGTDHVEPEELTADSDRLGIIPRAVSVIFERLARLKQEARGGLAYSAKNSYIELYNEDLIDLLAGDVSTAERPMVTIREDKAGNIMWTGLREIRVGSAADVMANLEIGSSLRQTNSTDMNSQSSRSHAIFSLVLTQRKWAGMGPPPSAPASPTQSRFSRLSVQSPGRSSDGYDRPASPSGLPSRPGSRIAMRPASALGVQRPVEEQGEWVTVQSKLNFVDLAGSERLKRTAAAGERVKEGIAINSGLHALGNVISALGDPAKARQTTHIPYRDSKLTRLLQDSLGGNAHTLMVACISPTEINVGETLNTLKYANRARNIKNRAELNEVELGWDDLDYLQALVTKLRAELAAIKTGQLNGLGISEGGRAVRELAPRKDLLDLQQRYSDLAAKHAKLTAEIAKEGGSPGKRPSLSPEDFQTAMAPVVEEYEKTLNAVESQLALTRAALAHSDDSIREFEDTLRAERAVNESNGVVIDELRSRVAKLAEREAGAEAHIRDLESRLKDTSDGDERVNALIEDLRKELARSKERQAQAERYIQELEARLSKGDTVTASLQTQISNFGRDAQRREEAYRQLELRLNTLDNSVDHKALLQELDERGQRMMDLERELDEVRASSSGALREGHRLSSLFAIEAAAKTELEGRVHALEAEVSRVQRSPSNINGAGSPMPPIADNNTDVADLRERLDSLQAAHTKTQSELEAITRKYKDSLQEIEILARQVSESRLSAKDPSSSPTSPLPSPLAPSSAAMVFSQSDGLPPRPSSRASMTSPTRTRRTSTQGGSGRVAIFGRASGQAAAPGGPPSHSRSASLSSELGGRAMPPNGQPRSHSPIPSLRDRRLSLAGMHTERSSESLSAEVRQLQDVLATRDKEIAVLESRLRGDKGSPEEEQTETLASPTQSKNFDIEQQLRQDAMLTPTTQKKFDLLRADLAASATSEEGETEQSARINELMRSMAAKETAHKELVDKLQTSLTSLRRQHDALETLSKDQLRKTSTEIERLTSELTESTTEISVLKTQLALSDGKVAAKAQELERVQQEHVAASEQMTHDLAKKHQSELVQHARDHEAALAALRAAHAEKLRQVDTAGEDRVASTATEHAAQLRRQTEQHSDELQRARSEHARIISGLEEQRDLLTRQRDEDLAALIKQNELQREAMEQTSQEGFDATLNELRSAHDATLERYKSDHAMALSRLEAGHQEKLVSRTEEHTGSVARLRQEHKAVLAASLDQYRRELEKVTAKNAGDLESQQAEHQQTLRQLREGHAEELDSQVTAAKKAADAAQTMQQRDMAALEGLHDAAIQKLKSSHASHIQELKASHAQALQTALQERETAMKASSSDQASTAAAIERMQGEHKQALEAANERHTTLLTNLQSERDGALKQSQLSQTDNAKLQELAKEVEARCRDLQTQVANADKARLEAAAQQKKLSDQLEEMSTAHANEVAQLRQDLGIAVTELQRRSTVSSVSEDPQSELQEALDALNMLESALQESQDERSKLASDLEELRQQNATFSADSDSLLIKARSDLVKLRAEHEKVCAERERQDLLLRELQSRAASVDSGRRDNSIDSNGSELEFVDAQPSPLPNGPTSPWPNAMPSPTLAAMRTAHSSSPHPPPPTPPPKVPPPNVPLPPLPGSSGASTASTAVRSSTVSTVVPAVRTSAQAESSVDVLASSSGSGSSDGITVDSRVQRKLEEQETTIGKLNDRLNHCEADLRANLDLVGTLENALNESERNIRKARLQMNDLAKERDSLQRENDDLRKEADEASQQVETVRQSHAASQREAEERVSAEREARTAAREQLDRRIETMRGKRSKYACF